MAMPISIAADPHILAMGDLVHDVLVHSEEEELSLESDITAHIVVRPGGSAANFAVHAARLLGGRSNVGFISKVGQDDSGLTLVQSLRREGVQTHIAIAGEGSTTGTVLVFINRSGRRTMVTDPGASRSISVAEIEQMADIITACRAFHLTSYSLFTDPPRPAAIRACQIAKSAGAVVSLDPSSHHLIDLMGLDEYARLVHAIQPDIFLPNIDEGRLLTGESEPPAIVAALSDFAPLIVLKLGAEGCWVGQHDTGLSRHVPTAPATVVDTTGAGDAFAAAFVTRYLHTANAFAAAHRANEVAADIVSRLGAR